MKINRRERKAVRNRNYVQAQYHKVQHMKRAIATEMLDLEVMTRRQLSKPTQWEIYSK